MKTLLFSFAGLVLAAAAHADSVNVQLYRAPFNLNYGLIESAVPDNAPWDQQSFEPKIFAAANYSYVKDPLVTINTTNNSRANTLVNSVHTLDLAAGYFFRPDISVFAQLPIAYSNVPGASGALGLADARLAAKIAILERQGSSLHFALVPEIDLPTGDKARFLSDGGLGAGLLAVAENDFGGFRLSGNLGYRYNASAHISGLDYRNRIPLGVGAAIPVARRWLVNIEGSGALALPTAQKQNASEFYAGASYSPKKYMTWLFGAALGAFDQVGSSQYRVLAGLRMYLGEEKAVSAPFEAPAPAPPPPPPPRPAPAAPVARLSEDQSHIEISEEVQFENNKATLRPRGKQVLHQVAELIQQNAARLKGVQVEGHTSHTGTYKHNMQLSWQRARAVTDYLSKEEHIPAKLLVPKGFGWTRPKYKLGRATTEQLAQNRRVEFKVLPK